MRNYSISTQKKSIQAYKKEYLNYLKNAIDSLYTYLHYYNPQWRLLEDNSGYHTKTNPNLWINKASLESDNTLLIEKLQYRWGYKNTSDHIFWYGPNYTFPLNIGATIYKKDAYDVSNPLDSSDLDHYILFEASLAQYVTWTFSTGVDENNNAALIYNYHISNELDFGLMYNIQAITSAPRYFYKEGNNTTYNIKYEDNVFDRKSLFDYININVQYKNNGRWIPSHSGTDYQYWSGATELFPQTVYEINNQYEDLIADTELYERPGNISTYQVRLEKSKDDKKDIEKLFEVIFS